MEEVKENVPSDNKFLGTEKVGKLLRMFSIPCVLSLIIQALYNIVDQIFIGQSGYLPLGNDATGFVYPLTVIALALGLFIGDGTAAILSINQGKNQTKDSHKSVGTGFTIGLIVSVVLLIISYVFCEPILYFFGARGDYMAYAMEYSTWIIAGFPLFLLACVLNPIIRADGSPKYAMLAMAIGAVTNIILDPILLNVAKMGMTGAALATFIGQAITFILHAVYFIKSKSFKLNFKSFIPDFKLLLLSLKLGISSFLTQFAIVIISVVSNNVLIAHFMEVGSTVGIFTVAFKVFGIVVSVAIGIASGGQPILGYNYGAKNYDRVKATLKYILIATLIVGVIATILFEALPEFILSWFGFTKHVYGEATINFGISTFRIYLGFILLTCLTKVVSIFFQAIGMPVKATVIAMLRDVITLVPLTIVMPLIIKNAFFWSAPISDIITTIVAVILLIILLVKLNNTNLVKADNEKVPVIKKSKPGVIVTISREHGAGGREIGMELAKKLNIPFYDKEVTMLAASESGLAQEFIENVEDKTSLLYNLYLSNEANQTAIAAQQKILQKIADNGTCVIVGRAADVVLADYNPLKVLIYAPLDYKVKRIMKNYGDNEKLAKENIEKSDKRRSKFYKTVTGKKWADKENYNLVIDSSVGTSEVVNIICNYYNDLNKLLK